MNVHCTIEEGGVRPKLDRSGWGEGVRAFNYGFNKWMTPVIASIKYFFVLSVFFIGSKETVHVCRGKIETFW